jgi:hypothetical protein
MLFTIIYVPVEKQRGYHGREEKRERDDGEPIASRL